MIHSHLPIQHLLKQVETYTAKRNQRDIRPDWVTDLINDVAELFEPFSGLGRVGFECQLAEDRWEVSLYLGRTEIVGGKEDGKTQNVSFSFNLQTLIDRLTEIDQLRWNAFPDFADDADNEARSHILIEGWIGSNPIRLLVYSVPPDNAGPGLREYPDGRTEPV